MVRKSIRFRNLVTISTLTYSLGIFFTVANYRDQADLSQEQLNLFLIISAVYVVLTSLVIGRLAKWYRFDFASAQKGAEGYKAALTTLGRVPLKTFLAFIVLSTIQAVAVNFLGDALGMHKQDRFVLFVFQFSLVMFDAAYLFVLSDQLVSSYLKSCHIVHYPLDYKYGRQTIKNLIIPFFIGLMSVTYSLSLVAMVANTSASASSSFNPFSSPVLVFLCLLYLIVVGILVVLWAQVNKNVYGFITQQLEQLVMGDKNLRGRVEIMSVDELGLMSGLVNEFCSGLATSISSLKSAQNDLSKLGVELKSSADDSASAISQIGSSVESVVERVTNQSASVIESSSAVEEIAKNIESMESLITEQASSVSEASASIEEMVGNINSVTVSIDKMAEQFSSLLSATGLGKQALSDSASRIQQISERSKALLEANKVIATIASQTNLLAMNAAIEAAHAGDAGRGFSVVADEIRHLAETSSTQSKTIRKEIVEVQRAIEEVVTTSKGSSEAFGKVAELIGETDALVREAHAAMLEQREGSMQILEALKAMNSVTIQVQDGSREMSAGNATVLEEIERLRDNTVKISESMAQMSLGSVNIREHAKKVAELAKGTMDTIETVDLAIGDFKI